MHACNGRHRTARDPWPCVYYQPHLSSSIPRLHNSVCTRSCATKPKHSTSRYVCLLHDTLANYDCRSIITIDVMSLLPVPTGHTIFFSVRHTYRLKGTWSGLIQGGEAWLQATPVLSYTIIEPQVNFTKDHVQYAHKPLSILVYRTVHVCVCVRRLLQLSVTTYTA